MFPLVKMFPLAVMHNPPLAVKTRKSVMTSKFAMPVPALYRHCILNGFDQKSVKQKIYLSFLTNILGLDQVKNSIFGRICPKLISKDGARFMGVGQK